MWEEEEDGNSTLMRGNSRTVKIDAPVSEDNRVGLLDMEGTVIVNCLLFSKVMLMLMLLKNVQCCTWNIKASLRF